MPFHSVRDTEVVYKVIQGERPTIPANASEVGISEDLWKLLVKCWNHDYLERPKINEILGHLSRDPALGLIFLPPNLPRAPSCESMFVPSCDYLSIADLFVTAKVDTPTEGMFGAIL